MCGIFGWQLRKGAVDDEAKELLFGVLADLMDERGGDSWGVHNALEGEVTKGLGHLGKTSLLPDFAKSDFVLCHTRKATTGGVCKPNSHPFKCGRVIGSHNGMVFNHKQLNWDYDRKCTVDSQHIFHHLDEGLPLHEIEAYGTIQFTWKSRPDAAYLGAFNDGDLTVYQIPGGIVWASTAEAVRCALRWADVRGRRVRVKQGRLYQVCGGKFYHTGAKLTFTDYLGWGKAFAWKTR